ncbi:hypothetical protein [uncultured Aquimarina sp.]|uniref:hypothetical protein n=1 Tax=uncultured Aquimarina sp. TaxID=575652 RepID=UPI00262417A7|nr:hypothetical protein [uncultured Aquimarina sp.]
MKTIKFLTILSCFILVPVAHSQVIIDGGVSVDVNINLPIPDVVVIGRKEKPKPRPRKPVIHSCDQGCNHHNASTYGEIQNQNGPYGRRMYMVVQAKLEEYHNGLEKVIYRLDSGDVLELIIVTANENDYNYHSYANCECNENNKIIEVLLNGQYIPLRDGSLSLQPRTEGFHTVINLHSHEEGDFNGTINF